MITIKIDDNEKKKGMTLIEITLVIAILLGLLSAVFIGIQAYQRGIDRAECILRLSVVQKLALSEANISGMAVGVTLDESFLVNRGYLSTPPDCPDVVGDYTFEGAVVAVNVPYATCNLNSDSRDHSYLN